MQTGFLPTIATGSGGSTHCNGTGLCMATEHILDVEFEPYDEFIREVEDK